MKITDPPGVVLKQSQLERGWPQYKHSQVGARIHDFGEQFLDGSSGLSSVLRLLSQIKHSFHSLN